ncbi:MAG: PLP-dependent transferase [Oscillospiraceae bacterium]
MNTPFYDAMAALAARGPRFFVPGHKGNPAAIPAFGPLLAYDLTEIEGADDLAHPAGPLAESQRNMARAYGSGATLYSASGATSCVQAMLRLFVPAGGGVVMARGCHVAAVRALAFLDAAPHWVPLRAGRPQPQDIAAALRASGYKAVYITSPDYTGRMADVAGIAAVCRENGAALLVDNAHGAHLRFCAPDRHPLTLGADACADSAHKTLPCLTPAALLHLRDKTLADAGREALNLFCSTSPAYPVLMSLDLAAGQLLDAPPDFDGAARRLARAARPAAALLLPCDDTLRLCLCPAAAGLSYGKAMARLKAAGIAPEWADGSCIVLMASPYNTEADFAQLEAVIEQLKQDAGKNQGKSCDNSTHSKDGGRDALHAGALPKRLLSIREALLAPHRRLPVEGAVGRVVGGLHAPCPPGVPVVLPGEVLGEAQAEALGRGGILAVDVVE